MLDAVVEKQVPAGPSAQFGMKSSWLKAEA
jgi:hypothetical protein